ncbi:arginase family protein [Isoptericola sp. NPDC019693]|uniref:arginase family protein n=1 Tax=Isoptericola sp. NPDC019693 TaxID=3364009 RepID=UPI0037B145D5
MIALLSAPTNLGLRPPAPGRLPGTWRAPEALRAAGLHRRLASAGAVDAGIVEPGPYVDDDGRRPPGTIRNQAAVVDHARRLSRRIVELVDEGRTPLVLGGDCSLLVGAGLALRSLAARPGAGLVHVDGHTDFRHPGNSDAYGSLAGEDLAAAVGLHLPEVADVDGLGPYVEPARAVHVGCRDDDEEAAEVRGLLADVVPAAEVIRVGGTAAGDRVLAAVGTAGGFWLQVDVDVLDPTWMPAVDSPDAGGLDPDQLVELLRTLAPWALGASVTVFDPELDPDGRHAATVADVVVRGLGTLGSRR